jgi:hypothetical protein
VRRDRRSQVEVRDWYRDNDVESVLTPTNALGLNRIEAEFAALRYRSVPLSRLVTPVLASGCCGGIRSAVLFDEEIRAFHQLSVQQRTIVLRALMLIANYVLADMYQGVPNTAQVEALAAGIAERDTWSGLTREDYRAYLTLVAGNLTEELPTDAAILVTFVGTAVLLSGNHPAELGWWQYLDQVEAIVEEVTSRNN